MLRLCRSSAVRFRLTEDEVFLLRLRRPLLVAAICNQYTIEGDLFSRAILESSKQAIPLEDAVKNMAVIDAIFRSAFSARWEAVPQSVV